MSIFNFPRINFNGNVIINVGTGNNDDYSGDTFPDPQNPSGPAVPLRASDSINVQPTTYGMDDNAFATWMSNHGNLLRRIQKYPRGMELLRGYEFSIRQRQNKQRAAFAGCSHYRAGKSSLHWHGCFL